MNTHAHASTNKNSWDIDVLWARIASFGQLDLISDPVKIFQKSWNGIIDYKTPENTKYPEIFTGH